MDYKRVVSFLLNMIFNIIALTVVMNIGFKVINSSVATGRMMMQKDSDEEAREVIVYIEEGATLAEIADLLEENEVINSALLFRAENMLKGNTKGFNEGTFALNTKMDATDIVNVLKQNKTYTTDIVLTIAEGYSMKNIADLCESEGLFTAEEFINACNNSEFDYDFLANLPQRTNRLEGYLFPDTYYIAPGSSPETVINKLLTRFDEIYSRYKFDAEQRGLTTDQVVIMASIIEKEVRVESERPKVAQVIYNRIDSNMNLQMCSTILYALDKHKERLYDSDLQVDSPYNTYTKAGLPIGPISNPGEACIKAVVNPEESDLLFFVVKDENSGEHVFTNNYDEFLKAKTDYNQKY